MTTERTYTDAYGIARTERIPVRYRPARYLSLTKTQPIGYTRPEYLTRLGCVVAMLQSVRIARNESNAYHAKLATHYRNSAIGCADPIIARHIARLWNQATAPRPFLP